METSLNTLFEGEDKEKVIKVLEQLQDQIVSVEQDMDQVHHLLKLILMKQGQIIPQTVDLTEARPGAS